VFPEQNAKSPRIVGRGASTTIAFRATRAGDFTYLCSAPGHELAACADNSSSRRAAAQVLVRGRHLAESHRGAGARSASEAHRRCESISMPFELEGRLAEGTTFGYWTFNGRVPGPMLRVRVGDTVDVRVKNSADSTMIHSVDFHAATGRAAEPPPHRSIRVGRNRSSSKLWSRVSMSTIARRRWWPTTSPTACTE
jgi:nitrite reductase (NO-forming)